MPIPVPDTR